MRSSATNANNANAKGPGQETAFTKEGEGHNASAPGPCTEADRALCGKYLDRVSRSFAVVIRQLPAPLALPVCAFYLVLRALDTIEDEMDTSKFEQTAALFSSWQSGGCDDDDNNNDYSDASAQSSSGPFSAEERTAAKVKALCGFHLLIVSGDERSSPRMSEGRVAELLSALSRGNVGEGHEAALLRDYGAVRRVCAALPQPYSAVIKDICAQMGAGMAEYAGRDLRQGLEDTDDLDNYCHIVAGLVGEGLTRLFQASGLENFSVRDSCGVFSLAPNGTASRSEEMLQEGRGCLASDMGLFLQKTNILRDFLEDLVEGRAWYPKKEWKEHLEAASAGAATSPRLEAFAEAAAAEGTPGDSNEHRRVRRAGMLLLNSLLVDALRLVPRCLRYMSELRDASVLRFCAVPQCMAIATLAELYANPLVFKGVVKVRKPLACRIMLNCGTTPEVKAWFLQFLADIERKDGENQERDAALGDASNPHLAAMRTANSAALAGVLSKIRAEL